VTGAAGTNEPRTLVARLFGSLLLREINGPTLAALQDPDTAAALADLGIDVPATADLDELAAEYFATVLQPAGAAPLVHSLWRDGSYEGDPAVAVRRTAASVGLVPGTDVRHAPVDHLGCLLDLWAELRDTHPHLAAPFARQHLAWVPGVTARFPTRGFYGSLIQATGRLCADLAATSDDDPRDG